MSRAQTYPTVEEIRAAVEAGKRQAMIKFEADWGTRDVGKVMMRMGDYALDDTKAAQGYNRPTPAFGPRTCRASSAGQGTDRHPLRGPSCPRIQG
jgi:hypothetical protein